MLDALAPQESRLPLHDYAVLPEQCWVGEERIDQLSLSSHAWAFCRSLIFKILVQFEIIGTICQATEDGCFPAPLFPSLAKKGEQNYFNYSLGPRLTSHL